MTDTKPSMRRRSPNGIDKRQIAMRLLPSERQQFDLLAKEHGYTDGALAREIYLLGLPLWKATHAAA